jgi:hypothetical protein
MRRIVQTFANAMTTVASSPFERVAQAATTRKKFARTEIITRGRPMKTFICTLFALAAGIVPASAITVTTPQNGAQLNSPFSLVASTESCDSASTISMGYSLDNGATTIVKKKSFSSMVIAGDGQHVLHVKCWGPHDARSDTSLNITIVPTNTTVPSNVTVVSDIQSLPNWAWNHDPGTPGDSSGTSDVTNTPSMSGNARQFSLSFSDSGGEIFHSSFGKDTAATHFIYDAYVWLTDASTLANIEMDMNQVMANGDTVIYGVQCNGYSGTWDYALNPGAQGSGRWNHSNVACPEPKNWEPNTWHHVELSYFRDSAGNVTYQSVSLDGQLSDFVNATGNSAQSLGWGPTLLTNFQLDGHGAEGSITAYLDKVTVSRW